MDRTADDDITMVGEEAPVSEQRAPRRSASRNGFLFSVKSLMNFGALVVLFSFIFLLQDMGIGSTNLSKRPETKAAPSSDELKPTKALPEAAHAAAVAAIPAEPVAALAPEDAGGEEEEMAPEAKVEAAPAPTPEKPSLDRRSIERDKRAIARYEAKRRAAAMKRGAGASYPYAADRAFPVAELDNEATRMRYLAANRDIGGANAPSAIARTDEASAAPSSEVRLPDDKRN